MTAPLGSATGVHLIGTWKGIGFSVIVPPNVAPGERFVVKLAQTQNADDQTPPKSLNRAHTSEIRSSFFSRMFFMWITPLVCLSGKRSLESSDLWESSERDRTDRVTTEVQHLYTKSKVAKRLLCSSVDSSTRHRH